MDRKCSTDMKSCTDVPKSLNIALYSIPKDHITLLAKLGTGGVAREGPTYFSDWNGMHFLTCL